MARRGTGRLGGSRRRAFVLAFAVVVAAVAAWLLLSERTDSPDVAPDRQTPVGAAAPGLAAASPPVREPPPPLGSVRIRVVDERTGRRVPSASVAAWHAPSVDALERPLESDAEETVVTDAEGEAAIRVLDRTRRLRVVAEGYAAHHRSLAPTDRDVVARLRPESTLSGRVLRLDERPVSGVEVLAQPWDATPAALVERLTGRGLEPDAIAVTDAEGRFTLRGLAPGLYALRSRSDEWIVYEAESQSPEHLGRVEAPNAGVVLWARPLRFVRLTLADGETGVPIRSAAASVKLRTRAGDWIDAERIGADASPPPGFGPRAREVARSGRLYLWVLRTEREFDTLQAVVSLDGYESRGADVRVERASEVGAVPDSPPIALRPVGSPGRTTLRVRVPLRPTTLPPGSRWLAVGLSRPPGGQAPFDADRGHWSGIGVRGSADGEWSFEGAPSGEWILAAEDGLGRSVPRRVSLRDGGLEHLTLDWEPVTGIAVEVVEAGSGRPLLGASVLAQSEATSGRIVVSGGRLSTATWVSRGLLPALGTDVVEAAFVPIRKAGRYSVIVTRAGYGTAKVEVDVPGGTVVPLRVELAPR